MEVTLVYVQVKPEHREDFIRATEINHKFSVQEDGNLRFDILQDKNDPNAFLLYEAYVDTASAAAHKQTPHYFAWRDAVVGWMAVPRRGVGYTGLWPRVE